MPSYRSGDEEDSWQGVNGLAMNPKEPKNTISCNFLEKRKLK